MQKQSLTFADLVNLLFDHIPKPNGKMYRTADVARATGIAFNTMKYIRDNHTPNPGVSSMLAIARFFNVPFSYFESETKEQAVQVINLAKNNLKQVEHWAFRIAHLSENSQHDIFKMVASLEQAEAAQARTHQEEPVL